MSDCDKSKERIDPFSEYIRDRLVDKPTSPDTDCWDKIDARLQKKRAISPVLYGLAIAASIIVAVFIINDKMIEKENLVHNEAFVIENNNAEKEIPKSESAQEKVLDETELEDTHKDIIAETKSKNEMPVNKQGENYNVKEEEVIKDTHEKTPFISSSDDEVLIDLPKNNEAPSVAEDKRPSDSLIYFDLAGDYDFAHKESEKNNKFLMLAGLGSAGGLGVLLSSLNISSNSDPTFNKSPESEIGFIPSDPTAPGLDTEFGEKNPESRPMEEITDIKTSLPISYGITVQKGINSTFGIETGLVYTYLTSDLKISNANYTDATLKLHYIGIPVNLIVNLWDKRAWNIYASAGGMVEKGLQSVYQKKGVYVYNENSKEKSSISGLQWSLNGGIGLSYDLYKDINLYVEPGVSYYFDNDQPISKRTEDPFSFNLRLGLRYNF